MPPGENCLMDNTKTNLTYEFICELKENSVLFKQVNRISYCEYEFELYSKYACEEYLKGSSFDKSKNIRNNYFLSKMNFRNEDKLGKDKVYNEDKIYLFLIGSALLIFFFVETIKYIINNNDFKDAAGDVNNKDTNGIDFDYCEFSVFYKK